ncbi:XRE family transcriptional regulator [Hamadaea sp. NPDC051192]|uniref:XRE family transcriptional regulator n=1 Tax=Hamadaea sp. NPDC051192 TaxID=3154940 RepID=UPI00342171DF
MGDDEAENAAPSLAERLSHLFETVHPAGRGPYTNSEAANLINKQAGRDVITSVYLWQLRTGKRRNPSQDKLALIAKLFDVPLAYFTDDASEAETAARLELMVALREAGIREIAMESVGLSDQSLRVILDMVRNARRLEGLPMNPADS